MRGRFAALLACSMLAAVSLLTAVTACITRLEFVIGTPQRLPVLIIECGDRGRWSMWYLTTSEESISKPKTEMYSRWLYGGQQVTAPVIRYVKRSFGFVIECASGTAPTRRVTVPPWVKVFRPRTGVEYWPATDVIRNGRATSVIIDPWKYFLLFSIYPAVVLIRGLSRHSLRERRRNDGLCMECGYNLTGNVSGVCPECGAAIGDEAKKA